MRYDPEQERWTVFIDKRLYGLHCGESFGLFIGTMLIPCRLEFDQEWYIIMRDTRFILRNQDRYMITI